MLHDVREDDFTEVIIDHMRREPKKAIKNAHLIRILQV
jgi:hypothetical protein